MLIITRGLPASGKTTWVRNEVANYADLCARVGRDDFRHMLHGDGLHGIPAMEAQVTAAELATVEALLRKGKIVYVDDTNLRARVVRGWAAMAHRLGVGFHVHDLTHVPVDVCLERNRNRANPIPDSVITGMYERYLAGRALPLPVPTSAPGSAGTPYVPNPGTTLAIMVDIDGTLALHGDRNPYDTSRYSEDTLNWAVAQVVYALFDAGYAVVFCSGRSEDHRNVTQEWLDTHLLRPYRMEGHLHMRPAGDTRRDDIIKLELFDTHIRHNYNVVAVFDDRDRVVQMWRSLGLTVFQVAPGDF